MWMCPWIESFCLHLGRRCLFHLPASPCIPVSVYIVLLVSYSCKLLTLQLCFALHHSFPFLHFFPLNKWSLIAVNLNDFFFFNFTLLSAFYDFLCRNIWFVPGNHMQIQCFPSQQPDTCFELTQAVYPHSWTAKHYFQQLWGLELIPWEIFFPDES